MATRGGWNLIWLIVALIFIGIGLWFGGSLVGLPDGDQCVVPDGCQCGIATKCGQWQTCRRSGPFGSCKQ